MDKSKWIVFDKTGKRIKTVILNHPDGKHYLQLEPFEKEMKEQGLYAHRSESFEQYKGTGIPFKQQLKYLGWDFDNKGNIIADW